MSELIITHTFTKEEQKWFDYYAEKTGTDPVSSLKDSLLEKLYIFQAREANVTKVGVSLTEEEMLKFTEYSKKRGLQFAMPRIVKFVAMEHVGQTERDAEIIREYEEEVRNGTDEFISFADYMKELILEDEL
ncbi:MAG: hypothetical protein FWB74_04870 [Defluviitaleaceae bacterium]|nr:hypothetical protein [Defluviitaleaceae bacterium]